jgi:hypothetical protein
LLQSDRRLTELLTIHVRRAAAALLPSAAVLVLGLGRPGVGCIAAFSCHEREYGMDGDERVVFFSVLDFRVLGDSVTHKRSLGVTSHAAHADRATAVDTTAPRASDAA